MTIRIPAFFYWDHVERDLDTPENFGTHDRVEIDPFAPEVLELLDDAAYYCDECGPDAIGDGGKTKRAALALIKAILKARPELANSTSCMRGLMRQRPNLAA
jgi:hypothetical protein